jgi:hypothetical protein
MLHKDHKASIDYFAHLTCPKHKARYSFVCPENECFANKSKFLCASCLRGHKADHATRALPYSDVFSSYMIEELSKWQRNEYELKKTIDKFYPDLHHQIDQVYKQIADDILRYLEISKEALKKRFSAPIIEASVNDLSDSFNQTFANTFDKTPENISDADLKVYTDTYSEVNNSILTTGQHLADLKDRVEKAQKEVPHVISFVNKESEKLRKYYEVFIKSIGSFKVVEEGQENDETDETNEDKAKEEWVANMLSNMNITQKLEGAITTADDLDNAVYHKLTDLDIRAWFPGDNQVAAEIANKLVEVKVTLNTLKLQFFEQKISNDGLKSLCGTIGIFKQLTSFTLDIDGGESSVNTEGCKYLSQLFSHLTNLTDLEIRIQRGQNQINDEGVKALAQSIEKLTRLTHLNLYFSQGDNAIKDEGIKALGESLEKLQNITHLKLYMSGDNNAITDEGLAGFSRSVAKMSSLVSIMLYFNGAKKDITDQGVTAFASSLENLKKLIYFAVNFGGHRVTSKGKEALQTAARKINVANALIMGIRS